MKLMVIKSKNSSGLTIGILTKLLKSKHYYNCSAGVTKEILVREKPDLVYTNIFKPVNGDNDVMTMLSSMNVNTRLRVFIINLERNKEHRKDIIKDFVLPGRDQHRLDTQ